MYSTGTYRGDFEAFTMFIDLTDFTPLTERMMKRGKDGAEQLSMLINGIFSPLVQLVYQHKGFVPYFAGDSFTAIFPKQVSQLTPQEFLRIAESTRDLVRGLPPVEAFRVSAKIGLSEGEVQWGIVGDVLKSFFFRGQAIFGSADAQRVARDQEIVLDAGLASRFADQDIFEPVGNQPFFRLVKHTLTQAIAESRVDLVPLSPKVCNAFLPDTIIESEYSGEFRSVISIFISFAGAEDFASLRDCSNIVLNHFHNYGGYFKEIDFGDKGGVMIGFFGAPVSYEDVEERALTCITSIVEDLQHFQSIWPHFRFRIGATKGIAFAGIIGGEERCQYAVVGNAVNLAARLMSKADWGEVLVDESLIDDKQFAYQHKADMQLKGVATPVPAYLFNGRAEENEEETFGGFMVGREDDLEKLLAFAKPLAARKPAGVVMVFGEGGVGKSRFISHFHTKFNDVVPDTEWIRIQSDLILRKPFQPFLQFLKRCFQQNQRATPEENRQQFERHFQRMSGELANVEKMETEDIQKELVRTKPVLATLVGLSVENSFWDHLDARGRYDNTVSAIVNLLTAKALRKPLVLELEDAHSLDENSLGLLNQIIRRLEYLPMMILAVARYQDDGSKPEIFKPAQIGRIPLLEVNLKAFTREEVFQFTTTQLSRKISDEFLELLIRVTNGNPFYLEQVLQYFSENRLLKEENGLLTVKDSEVKVSDSLQSILMARIDKLSNLVKETVKTAAVIGREFEVPILSEVLIKSDLLAETPATPLEVVKEQVKKAERVQILRAINELRYIFQHSLLREAVYDMQLRTRLKRLHQLIAEAIEKIYRDRLEEYALELAFHYKQAEIPQKAIRYLDMAAMHARNNYQNLQALDLYEQLLDILQKFPDSEEEIKTLLKKGSVHELIGQWDASETVLVKALSLTEMQGDHQLQGRAKNDLGRLYMLRGNYAPARNNFEQAIVHFEHDRDSLGISKVFGNLGNLFFRQGYYEQAKDYLQRSIEIRKKEGVKADAQNVSTLGLAFMNQGDYNEGIRWVRSELDLARSQRDKRSMATLLINLGIITVEKGDHDAALPCFEEGLQLSEELGNKLLISIATGCLGSIYQEKGDFVRAMESFQKDLFICLELGDKQGIAIANGLIGELLSIRGKFEDARRYLNQSLELSEALNYQKGIAKAVNNMGDIFYLTEQYENAHAAYSRAIDVTRAINNKLVLGKSLVEDGATLLELGRLKEAKAHWRESQTIAESLGNPDLLFQVEVLSAKIAIAEGDPGRAADILNKQEHDTLSRSQKATVSYLQFRLLGDEKYKQSALDLYRELYQKFPQFLFSKRLEELERA